MKINRLDFLAFGPFSNVSLDFAHEGRGLHLVYGANEAGKTSALRAIRGWLFGIPPRSTDNFVHSYKKMRLGGELENAAGETLAFLRRKGNKDDVLDPADNKALPAAVLDPFLGGMDGETFERIWGIDHPKLIEGGRQLQALKGLAGESLFAVALGITGLSSALVELEDDAQKIFRPDRRTKTAIRDAMGRYGDAVKTRRAAEVSVGGWNKIQKQLRAAQRENEELREKLKVGRRGSNRLDRILSALEDIGERKNIQAELAEYEDVRVLPPDYTPEARRQAQDALTSLAGQLEDARERLDGSEGLVGRRDALKVADGLLREELAIGQLQKKAGAYKKACDDLPKRAGERRLLQEQAERLLAEIDPSLEWDGAAKLRLTKTVEAQVGRLSQERGSLRQSCEDSAERITDLKDEIEGAETRLGDLFAPLELGALQRAIREAAREGDPEKLAADEAAASSRLVEQVDREIERLGLWTGSQDELDVLQLPLRATVDEYADRFRDLLGEKTKADEKKNEKTEARTRLEAKIGASQRQREIPSRAGLAEARERRETGWRLVRETWLGDAPQPAALVDFTGERDLPSAYEDAVETADGTADRLIEDSELSAKLEQQREQCRLLNDELSLIEAELETWGPRQTQLEGEWRSLWAQLGIEAPLSPKEMAEWLGRCTNVRGLSEQLSSARANAAKYEQSMSQHASQLESCLAEFLPPGDGTGGGFGELLARAQGLVESSAAVEQERKHLADGVVEKKIKLAATERKLETAEGDYTDWEKKWSAVLADLGHQGELSVEQANDRVQVIREYFVKRDSIADMDAKRIGPMRTDKDQFEKDVAQLVVRCGEDLVEQEPAAAADTLVQRLKRAQEATRDRHNLDEQIVGIRVDVARLEKEAERTNDRLRQLCTLAGVDDPDALRGLEESSRRKQELSTRLEGIERRLLKVGEGATVDELIAETEGKSSDDLRAERDESREEIEELEQKRDQATGVLTTLKQQSAAVDGSAAALAADQEALGEIAVIGEKAHQYLRLRLASNLLRRRIEKHRVENQDPMIARASELFARITCGSFAGLTLDYDDDDQPTIVGLRKEDGDRLPVEAFSKGSADQLYLSLRLAYLQTRLESGEPMPVILDDILVDFDDDRATAALKVLAEMSEKTQIVLLTHHAHVRELARSVLSSKVLKEHDLEIPA